MAKYVCSVCGYVHDEAILGEFDKLPPDYQCPICSASKAAFKQELKPKEVEFDLHELKELKPLSYGQMSILCSNLAKGCEKQYKVEEMKLFLELATHYSIKAKKIKTEDIVLVKQLIQQDLSDYSIAKQIASTNKDRGALRALVWNEKVTNMMDSILMQYKESKEDILKGKDIYVCEICGFIYIGNDLPKICPVCKVPNSKMTKVVEE